MAGRWRELMRRRAGCACAAAAVAAAISLLSSGCASTGARPPVYLPVPKNDVFLPVPAPGDVTFYLSLPSSVTRLRAAVAKVSAPGSPEYRRFSSLRNAARRFGATDAQIRAVAQSIATLGLRFAADPTRLFGRVTGSARQWRKALGTPLSERRATASEPFITYGLPASTPTALQPRGTRLLLRVTQAYDPAAVPGDVSGTPDAGTTGTAPPARPVRPWPRNTGTLRGAHCSAAVLQQRYVYTPEQIQTAYGLDALRSLASGTPVITVVDLGGGWLPGDLRLAGQCFGYSPPRVLQAQGDGIATAIRDASPETSLDVQTVAAVSPGAQLRLVQSTLGGGGILDGFSRAIGGNRGLPDVISLSYGGCAYAENRATPAYTFVLDAVLAMTALIGVSSFVAAGDAGSTTCGASVPGTTLSYPAVSPYVTAVGGTRLTLGPGNTRLSETVWNDSAYGMRVAGGGGLSRREPRPWYQDGFTRSDHRSVPDVSALADLVPGWPVVINSKLQTIGGTSGSTPFTAAAVALVAAAQRAAGLPRIGLANGWFYQAALHRPSAFFDVTKGSNDLAGVGCCHAAVGYDDASGLGVPNWAVLPVTLPVPG
jgi:subtilase family serine protease